MSGNKISYINTEGRSDKKEQSARDSSRLYSQIRKLEEEIISLRKEWSWLI